MKKMVSLVACAATIIGCQTVEAPSPAEPLVAVGGAGAAPAETDVVEVSRKAKATPIAGGWTNDLAWCSLYQSSFFGAGVAAYVIAGAVTPLALPLALGGTIGIGTCMYGRNADAENGGIAELRRESRELDAKLQDMKNSGVEFIQQINKSGSDALCSLDKERSKARQDISNIARDAYREVYDEVGRLRRMKFEEIDGEDE